MSAGNGAARVVGYVGLIAFLAAGSAAGQSLAEIAAKEKQRRQKAGSAGAPAYSNQDLQKLPDSAEARGGSSGTESAAPAPPAADDPSQDEAWWRARVQASRQAVDDALYRVEAEGENLEALRMAARTPPPAGTPRPVVNERRVAERLFREAHDDLARARKDLSDLMTEAKKKQIPAAWLQQ